MGVPYYDDNRIYPELPGLLETSKDNVEFKEHVGVDQNYGPLLVP